MCVCVFSSRLFWTPSSLDVPAGVTQECVSLHIPHSSCFYYITCISIIGATSTLVALCLLPLMYICSYARCNSRPPVQSISMICVCVCVFFPFILDAKFVGCTSRGHTGGRSQRIHLPPSFCGACLYFSREKDSGVPFPRRP